MEMVSEEVEGDFADDPFKGSFLKDFLCSPVFDFYNKEEFSKNK